MSKIIFHDQFLCTIATKRKERSETPPKGASALSPQKGNNQKQSGAVRLDSVQVVVLVHGGEQGYIQFYRSDTLALTEEALLKRESSEVDITTIEDHNSGYTNFRTITVANIAQIEAENATETEMEEKGQGEEESKSAIFCITDGSEIECKQCPQSSPNAVPGLVKALHTIKKNWTEQQGIVNPFLFDFTNSDNFDD